MKFPFVKDSLAFSQENSNRTAKSTQIDLNPEGFSESGWRNYIFKNFVDGSGILPSLCHSVLEFASDLEFSYGGDIDRPVARRLGWDEEKFTRFGRKANVNFHAAFLRNEDGSDWQAILNLPSEGKPYQYLAPKGVGDIPFFPAVPFEVRKKIAERFHLELGGDGIPPDGSFWDWLAANPAVPVVLTEGGKKALALLSNGIPAIALYGISCGVTEGHLKIPLRRLVSPQRKIIVAMDNDSNGSVNAQRNNFRYKSRLARAIQLSEGIARVMQWCADYKGVDDLIVAAPDSFERAWHAALYEPATSTMSRMAEKLDYRFGSRLKFNQLAQEIELDGHNLDLDIVKVFWAENFKEDQPTENIIQSLLAYSKKNAYDPVKDWLLEIESSNLPSEDFDCIASKYLGVDTSDSRLGRLANIYLKKTMIGAVARVFEPGCKLDTCTVLQGKQGLGKSSFWAALAGKTEFFDDSLSAHGCGDKDEKLKIARFWILELAELESLYRRKDVSSVRSLLTSSSDNIRPPYGRQIKCFPRRSIFVGSVNPADFLADSEGNRRFWVVPVERITIPSVDEVRRLYAAAIQAYRAGEKWYLTSEEEELQQEHNKNFEQSDPWELEVLRFAENLDYVKIPELLEAMHVPLALQSRRELNRVTDILKRHGYSRATKRVESKVVRVWAKSVISSVTGSVTAQNPVTASFSEVQPANEVDGSVTGSVTAQNPVTASFSESKDKKSNRVTDKVAKNKNNTEIQKNQKIQTPDEEKLRVLSNFSEKLGYTVTSAQNPVTASFSEVTELTTESVTGSSARLQNFATHTPSGQRVEVVHRGPLKTRVRLPDGSSREFSNYLIDFD